MVRREEREPVVSGKERLTEGRHGGSKYIVTGRKERNETDFFSLHVKLPLLQHMARRIRQKPESTGFTFPLPPSQSIPFHSLKIE